MVQVHFHSPEPESTCVVHVEDSGSLALGAKTLAVIVTSLAIFPAFGLTVLTPVTKNPPRGTLFEAVVIVTMSLSVSPTRMIPQKPFWNSLPMNER
jgi:hypothetical protein